jgi:hypothetical protein
METKVEKEQCVHHWLIDGDNSETSQGKCKICGMVKEFINDWDLVMSQSGRTRDGYRNPHYN